MELCAEFFPRRNGTYARFFIIHLLEFDAWCERAYSKTWNTREVNSLATQRIQNSCFNFICTLLLRSLTSLLCVFLLHRRTRTHLCLFCQRLRVPASLQRMCATHFPIQMHKLLFIINITSLLILLLIFYPDFVRIFSFIRLERNICFRLLDAAMCIAHAFESRITIAKLTATHTLNVFFLFFSRRRRRHLLKMRNSFRRDFRLAESILCVCRDCGACHQRRQTIANLFMNSHNVMSFGLEMHIEWQAYTKCAVDSVRRAKSMRHAERWYFRQYVIIFGSILFWCYDPVLCQCVSLVGRKWQQKNGFIKSIRAYSSGGELEELLPLYRASNRTASRMPPVVNAISKISCLNPKMANNIKMKLCIFHFILREFPASTTSRFSNLNLRTASMSRWEIAHFLQIRHSGTIGIRIENALHIVSPFRA